MRRRQERRARQAVSQARTVLFICEGNICRSPFAERLARSYPSVGKSFLSAGYVHQGGRRPPDVAAVTAARWNVALGEHRSRTVTTNLARQADVVLVFDYLNYRRIRAEYPFLRDRVHFVGALTEGSPLFIRDPWGKDMACFERTYGHIAAAVERLLAASGGHMTTEPFAEGVHNHG
jgi:protein-tyrosine-phosphatase